MSVCRPNRLWELEDITYSATQCEFCGTRIVWQFHLVRGSAHKIAGSECTKSLTNLSSPERYVEFIKGNWKQHRSYYYKKFAGLTWMIGPHRKTPTWWIAVSTTVEANKAFVSGSFTTPEDAKRSLAVNHMRWSDEFDAI